MQSLKERFWGLLEDPLEEPAYLAMSRLLAAEASKEAGQWRFWNLVSRSHPEANPLVQVLVSFWWGTSSGQKPAQPQQIDPANVWVYETDQGWLAADLLPRIPRIGWQTYFWSSYGDGEDCWWQINDRGTRLAGHVYTSSRDPLVWDQGRVHQYETVDAAAILMLRDGQLQVFPFPADWQAQVERARHRLGQMTATERARLEMDDVIQNYVELFGYEAVSTTLEQFKHF